MRYKKEKIIKISGIGNYYGGLEIQRDIDGRFYWGIENWNGTTYDEIPKELFEAIKDFEHRKSNNK